MAMKKARNVMSRLTNTEQTLDLDEHDQKIEIEVDSVKKAYTVFLKALDESHPHIEDNVRQMKKVPQHLLGSKMMTVGSEAFDTSNNAAGYGKLFNTCSRVQLDLGQLESDYHRGINKNVREKLSECMDDSLATLATSRKKVTTAKSELESCKKKVDQINTKGQIDKLEAAKAAASLAQSNMESALTAYSEGLAKFINQDKQLGLPMIDLVTEQMNYHRTALMLLEQAMPKLQASYTDLGGKRNRVFGGCAPAIGVSPLIVECCAVINRDGLDTEGIFRKQGSTSRIRSIRESFSKGTANLKTADAYDHDIHAIAAVIKVYFRELQEPLLVSSLYNDWLGCLQIEDHNEKLYAMQDLCARLPKGNFDTLKFISKFALNVSKFEEENKMSITNLALVFGPNLLWAADNALQGSIAMDTAAVSMVVETIFTYSEWLFPEEDGDRNPLATSFSGWTSTSASAESSAQPDETTKVKAVLAGPPPQAAPVRPKSAAPVAQPRSRPTSGIIESPQATSRSQSGADGDEPARPPRPVKFPDASS